MDVLTPLTPLALSIPLEVPHAGISDLNEDILHLIFEYFDLQPGSPTRTIAQNRKNLLSVAKTCKAFAKQALSLLWHVLPSLLPLLLLLPSAEVSNNHYVSLRPSLVYLSCHLTNFIKFVDRLPLGNWERFDIHAPQVRSLYMERLNIVISPHVYLRIRSLRHHDTPFLPGLKEIYIPNHDSLDLSSALLLASESSLKFIHLNNSATSDRQFFYPVSLFIVCQLTQPNSPHSPRNCKYVDIFGTGTLFQKPSKSWFKASWYIFVLSISPGFGEVG